MAATDLPCPIEDTRYWTNLPSRPTNDVRAPKLTVNGLRITFGRSERGRCQKASQESPHLCVLPADHDGPHWGLPVDVMRDHPNFAVKRIYGLTRAPGANRTPASGVTGGEA